MAACNFYRREADCACFAWGDVDVSGFVEAFQVCLCGIDGGPAEVVRDLAAGWWHAFGEDELLDEFED